MPVLNPLSTPHPKKPSSDDIADTFNTKGCPVILTSFVEVICPKYTLKVGGVVNIKFSP